MDAILRGGFKPRLITVEYNSQYPLDAAITFPNVNTEFWEGDKAYGASLKALWMVAAKHDYSLIAIESKLDLFFVRNDLLDLAEVPHLERWRPFTDISFHIPLRRKERMGMFVDYEEYSKHGDLTRSKEKALPIVERYIAN
eukprot:gnl/TRDRNA2_/TRDRNA2_29312_c0_seq1.p1 gnl/TRDRNA2_/TRDRNA2_29312_c0~~gnl/TRDRNA2_/TRDRNA2_29312_c0_seq1.p1  ORF type:complete len:141 (+),score=8.40 gnl/TRDRNA2_/TRDRNA2_29312_c0_seq1:392-814(+)